MAKILVVDDRAANREFLASLLGCSGHRVREAADGAEALSLCRAEPPDLVISDILMPTMDGYEFVRQLRSEPVTAMTPVIFCSAHYLKEEATSLAGRCGVSAILTKPADPEVILQTVGAALGLGPAEVPEPPDEFDREHLQLLTDKLSQKADELRIQNERLRTLVELSHTLNSVNEPDGILQFMCRGAREVTGARYGAVGILDERGQALRHFVTCGIPPELIERIGMPDPRTGVLATLLDERRPQRLRAGDGDPRHLVLPTLRIPVESFLGVPIISATKLCGWLCLFDKLGADAFTDQEEALVLTIAEQLGRLYENRNLVLDLQRRTADLEREIAERKRAQLAQEDEVRVSSALARIGSEMISSLDAPVLLNRLCRVTTEVLGCDASCTLEWRPGEGVFESVAGYSASPEEEEIMQVVRVPKTALTIPPSLPHQDDRVLIGTILPSDLQNPAPAPVQLGIVLRSGADLIGLQVGYWRDQPEQLTSVQHRIARGIAHMASLSLAHAHLVHALERASRLKSDFIATMSHELRTPLNVIIGYNDLLMEGEFGEIGAEQQSVLLKTHTSALHLLELVEATLDLSRLEKGKLPLETTEVSIPDIVARLEAEMLARPEAHGVRLGCSVDSNLPPLSTDPAKLMMVLRNLLGNAFKFTPAGSVTLAVRQCDQEIEFTITDTGIGIAPEDQTVIFEPFRQLEPYLTRRHGGVGLGLYVVHRLVTVLGGTVAVESEPGKGSTFYVRLPAATEIVASAQRGNLTMRGNPRRQRRDARRADKNPTR
jgi:signal transduction histidine kinase/CheY-like chemotaxis protein